MREYDKRIDHASDAEKPLLEQEKKHLLACLKRERRLDPSQVDRSKQRVDRLFRLLKNSLLETMPRFVEHLDAVRYDSATKFFVYEPGERPHWDFIGFP